MIYDYENYFFDFFGTLSLKKSSDSIFLSSWSESISEIIDIKPNIMMSIRNAATKSVSMRNTIHEFTFDDLMENMWNRILALFHYECSIEYFTFYNIGKKNEIEWKYNNQILNYKLINFAKNLKANGKTINILSDYYMGTDFIRMMLGKEYEDLFDHIFVSCEIGANKSSESAYSYLVKKCNINPHNSIMIGNNISSDIFKAKRNGFNARLIRKNGIK